MRIQRTDSPQHDDGVLVYRVAFTSDEIRQLRQEFDRLPDDVMRTEALVETLLDESL